MMGGLRFDRFDAELPTRRPSPTRSPASGAGTELSTTVDYDAELARRVVYKPMPNGSIYFDAGTSFNPSAEALSLSLATGALPPVKNKSYEIGSKWDLFDGQPVCHRRAVPHQQINVREPDPNNPLVNILAGDAVAKGGELRHRRAHHRELADPRRLRLHLSRIIDKSPVTGPASDLGHRLANTPVHTANLWTDYYLPWKIELGGGINVVSSRFAASTPTTAGGVAFFKEVPGYWTLGAMAKYPLNEHVIAAAQPLPT